MTQINKEDFLKDLKNLSTTQLELALVWGMGQIDHYEVERPEGHEAKLKEAKEMIKLIQNELITRGLDDE